MPGCEVARAEIRPRETVTAFLRRVGWATKDRRYGWQFKKGLPTILEVNGEPVLRKFWRSTRISASDSVRFVSFPLGGRGSGVKQVIGLVALVAVSAFALWAGPALFGAGTFGALATTAAIGVGGSLLVNALTSPKAGATNSPNATQDQIYSVQAQGNTAKLGQPLPVWYGRLKSYPDFAATPWGEFVGNDQYLNVLLSVGMGSFSYEQLYIDDTPLWDPVAGISPSFTGAQVAFYEAGDHVTLFPVNVDASVEVTGQQLPDGSGTFGGQYVAATAVSPGAWVGGFVANPSGTSAMAIAVDYVLPSGCFTVDTSNNNIGSANVGITAEYCPVNGAGAPTGPFTPLFSVVRSYASTSPIRDSIKTTVAPGRYQVRFRREDAGLGSTQGANSVVWAGLRSFLQGNNSFPDVATIAIRILATQSTQGSYKFGVLATRKLPVWNGSAFVTQPTRNNGWAFLDAVTNPQYGSTLPISKTDFNAIVNFAAGCDSRGDTFDYAFTAAVAVPAALDKILTPARARHFWLGDTVSVVRDEWRDVPSMLLTDREIVRDSTQVTWTMLGDEDPDAVIIEYIDDETWLPAQVQYPPNTEIFTAVNAEVKRIDGIVDRDQAFRECAFYYLQSIYRRENVQINVEYEGRAIQFGSALRVQSELPMSYGYGGAVVGASGTSLTLDPPPVWDAAPFYLRLRRPNGKWFGPINATMGADASIGVLNSVDLATVEASQGITLAEVLLREDGGEYPSFELGTADSQSKVCVVLSGVPSGELCTLSLVVDDERVHATDIGKPPVLPTSQFPSNAAVPLIVGLNANYGQGIAEPQLSAGWFPAAGAFYYVADVSYDSGKSWEQVYEGQGAGFTAVVTLGALILRVQAVGSVRGPYASLSLAAPTIIVANQTVALSSMVQGLKYQVTTLQDNFANKVADIDQLVTSVTSNEAARNWSDKQKVRTQLASINGSLSASISQVMTVATSTDAALASFEVSVSAQLGSQSASITTNSTAIATINGNLAASWAMTVDINGYISGLKFLANGTTSAFVINASIFQVFSPSFAGGAPINMFSLGTVNGTAQAVLAGVFIGDGIVTARSINVANLAAISGNMGSLTTGSIQSPDGKFLIDATNQRIVISD